MSVNKIILIGRLGQDPQLSYTGSGKAVAKFSIATTDSYKKGEEKVDETEWHNIVVWNKLAENCNQYLKKGRQVYVEGRVKNRTFEKKDGQKGFISEVVASTVQFLEKEKTADSNSYDTTSTYDVNDIPF